MYEYGFQGFVQNNSLSQKIKNGDQNEFPPPLLLSFSLLKC